MHLSSRKKELKKYVGKTITFRHTRYRGDSLPHCGILKEILKTEARIDYEYFTIKGLYDVRLAK